MTKIRNTKKGMAKKTLSISLAVAMLATSNVPVWAAEFTDGSAVEFTSDVVADAPVVEEEVVAPVAEVEAPVVDDVEEVIDAQDFNNVAYTSTATFEGNADINWLNSEITADVTVKANGENTTAYKYAWKIGDTAESAVSVTNGDATGDDLTFDFESITDMDIRGGCFGKNLYLYLYADGTNGIWGKTYKIGTIGAADLGVSQYELSWDAGFTQDASGTWGKTYDGKALPKNVKVMQGSTDRTADFDVNYSDDLKNAGTVTVKASLKDPKWYGVKELSVEIRPKEINTNTITDLKATLKDSAKSFVFTGDVVEFEKTDATLMDTETGDDVSELITKVVALNRTGEPAAFGAGEHSAGVLFDTPETVKNYTVSSSLADKSVWSENKYEIKARELKDCTFTFKAVQHKTPITAVDVRTALVSVVATDGTVLNADVIRERISVVLPDEGIDASSTTPYTVTIKPQGTTSLTGSTTAQVRVVNKDISKATYTTANVTAEEYTGKQITKDIATLIDDKKGLQLTDSNGPLEYDVNYTIEFGKNVDVKTGGTIIIVGHGDYEGSFKEIPFTINAAKVTDADLSSAKYLLFDEDVEKAEEYAKELGLVVKGHNAKKDEFTLVEGKTADYTVAYSFVDAGKTEITNRKATVGDFVKAVITLKGNGNFVKGTSSDTLTVYTELVDPVILDEHIQMTKDTYEYTGAPIVPEFKVVIGEKTLVKGKDYVIVNTQDVTEVGDAKVVITGAGKYSNKVNAEAAFKVVPTSAENVKVTLANDTVTYNGEAQEPGVTAVILGQKVSVKDQFVISYGENINAGKGTVILTPKKNNKNFTGTKTVEFTIDQAELEGTLHIYNKHNIEIDPTTDGTKFTYDGTAHKFAKEVFVPRGTLAEYVTADDYEIVYADNVYGKFCEVAGTAWGPYGAVMVVAKGNFKNTTFDSKVPGVGSTTVNGIVTDGVYTDSSDKEIKNVAQISWFEITQAEIHKNNITVSNGEYREGYNVKPNVTVTVGGKTLVEGTDYKLVFDDKEDRTKVTATKTLTVTVEPINGYKKAGTEDFSFTWGIDKFNFANAEILVSGTDANPIIKVLNDGIAVDPKNYDLKVEDGKATVSAKADAKNYEGSQTVEIKHALEKPEKPMLVNVKVYGNKATAVLSGESEGAIGYDYVIGTSRDCIETKDYVKVNKNKLTTETSFTYVQQGTYYAYCHAWTRDENGKKVFSDWSNPYIFTVTAVTPETPVITGYKVSGNTVTVTYTNAKDATGYDVVLGSTYGTVADEKRPLQYGELVKKNIKGNTVTATFKNVQAGTYYAGLHAFNRTAEDGKKVFSPWSNIKTIKVK